MQEGQQDSEACQKMDSFNCMNHDRTLPLIPKSSVVYTIIVSAIFQDNLFSEYLGMN
jgi:hypothetical protein